MYPTSREDKTFRTSELFKTLELFQLRNPLKIRTLETLWIYVINTLMMYILHWHMNFNRFRTELCNELILLLFFPFFFLPSIFMLTFRSYVHQLSNSSRCILLVRELGYEEGKTRKIWMERSRCCSSWGTCGLVRGAKEGKKEERRDTGDIIIVQDPDTIQLMEHVRGGRKLDWNALSFDLGRRVSECFAESANS